jgi:hypothetical protein
MKESFIPDNSEAPKPKKEKSQETIYRERYKNIPAAVPKSFTRSEEGVEGEIESPFKFPPRPVLVSPEVLAEIKDSGVYSTDDFEYRGLGKRFKAFENSDGVSKGEFVVSCCMRTEGDNNRIDKMISSLNGGGWAPAKIEHLLILAQTNPELFNDPVVAMGSEIKGSGNVPCLQMVGGKLEYHEHSRHWGFNKNYSFLIVQN